MQKYSLDLPINQNNNFNNNKQFDKNNIEIMKELEFRFNNPPLIMIFCDELLGTPIMKNKKINTLTTRVAQNMMDIFNT